MKCKLCRETAQPANFGSDIKCAFETGVFSGDNWNCWTVGLIRDLCYEGQELPDGVQYQYCDDMKYATIRMLHANEEDDIGFGMCLWVAWYKSRGRTDAMWIMDSEGYPRPPTEAECLRIADYYKSLQKES